MAHDQPVPSNNSGKEKRAPRRRIDCERHTALARLLSRLARLGSGFTAQANECMTLQSRPPCSNPARNAALVRHAGVLGEAHTGRAGHLLRPPPHPLHRAEAEPLLGSLPVSACFTIFFNLHTTYNIRSTTYNPTFWEIHQETKEKTPPLFFKPRERLI